jgi:hypothetical protein
VTKKGKFSKSSKAPAKKKSVAPKKAAVPNKAAAKRASPKAIKKAVAARSAPVGGQPQFFVLLGGPVGDPPMIQIRGPQPTAAAACSAPIQVVPAVPFTPTERLCSGGRICQIP